MIKRLQRGVNLIFQMVTKQTLITKALVTECREAVITHCKLTGLYLLNFYDGPYFMYGTLHTNRGNGSFICTYSKV